MNIQAALSQSKTSGGVATLMSGGLKIELHLSEGRMGTAAGGGTYDMFHRIVNGYSHQDAGIMQPMPIGELLSGEWEVIND